MPRTLKCRTPRAQLERALGAASFLWKSGRGLVTCLPSEKFNQSSDHPWLPLHYAKHKLSLLVLLFASTFMCDLQLPLLVSHQQQVTTVTTGGGGSKSAPAPVGGRVVLPNQS